MSQLDDLARDAVVQQGGDQAGPEQEWFDRSWQLDDIERID